MEPGEWSPYARIYDPLQSGSIDGTDTEPHDAAIVRAQHAFYRAPENLNNINVNTILVAHLSRDTTEETLRGHFKRYGSIKTLRIVRNIVTGFSQGYAFIEYTIREDAATAWRRGHETIIDGCEVIVEYEHERSLPGWIPRRLGGGFGGKKEAGQLRFGCRDKPFHKPFQLSNNQGNIVDTERNTKSIQSVRDRCGYQGRVRFGNRDGSRSQRPCDSSASRDRRRRDSKRSRSRDRSRDRRRDRSRGRDRSRSRDKTREYRR